MPMWPCWYLMLRRMYPIRMPRWLVLCWKAAGRWSWRLTNGKLLIKSSETASSVKLRASWPFSVTKFHYISALQGKGVGDLFTSIDQAYAAAMIKIPTPKLTRALQMALERQQPPLSGRIRPKMRYAHQGGSNPPVVVIHGNALEQVPSDLLALP